MPSEPISCLELHPNPRTVYLAGKPVNLMAIARTQGLDESYLSRILNGHRDVINISIGHGMKIAAALGMTLDDFIEAVTARQEYIEGRKMQEQAQLLMEHKRRGTIEQGIKTRARNQGRKLPPDIPYLGLST